MVKEQTLFRKSALFVKVLITLHKNVSKVSDRKRENIAAGDSDNRQTERMPRKCFGCVSEDHLIAKLPNPPKENVKRRKQVRFNEKLIVHTKTEKITVTKRYIHIWHVYLVMKNVLVEILVTVRN